MRALTTFLLRLEAPRDCTQQVILLPMLWRAFLDACCTRLRLVINEVLCKRHFCHVKHHHHLVSFSRDVDTILRGHLVKGARLDKEHGPRRELTLVVAERDRRSILSTIVILTAESLEHSYLNFCDPRVPRIKSHDANLIKQENSVTSINHLLGVLS